MTHRLLKIAILCLVFLTSTSCQLMWRFRGPCSIWPMDMPTSGTPLPQTFSSPAGRFTISLPPAREKVDEATGTRTFEWFIINHGMFRVLYFDRDWPLDTPETIENILNNSRKLVLSRGQLVSESELKLANHPGREFRVKSDAGFEVNRVYIVGNRVYVTDVIVAKSLDCKLDSAVKVLDTFEIIEENAVPAVLK